MHRRLLEIQQRAEVQHVRPRPGWLNVFQMCGEARGGLLAPLMHQCQHQWHLHVGPEPCPQHALARLQEGNISQVHLNEDQALISHQQPRQLAVLRGFTLSDAL